MNRNQSCTNVAKERPFSSSNQVKEMVQLADTEAPRLRPLAHPRLCQSTHAGSAAWQFTCDAFKESPAIPSPKSTVA